MKTTNQNSFILNVSQILIAVVGFETSQTFAQTSPSPIVTIDFQALQQTGTGFTTVGYVYQTNKFVFADSRGVNGLATLHTGDYRYTGSTMLYNNSYSDTSLSRGDSGEFDFIGMDLAKLDVPQSGPITFSGYRGSTLVVSETFNFNGAAGLQHFTPVGAFIKLTELRWPQQSPLHQFDNVQVRENGLFGPGPQARITSGASAYQLNFTYLKPGSTYIFQKSINLSEWQDLYYFTTYSPMNATSRQEDPNERKVFYRLKLKP